MSYTMAHPGDQPRLWAAVASLPCAHCSAIGVQVAHSNQLRDGKGRGLKAYPWRVAALCHTCHHELDQGKDLTKQQRREMWDEAHRWTIGELFRLGLVRPV